VPYVLPVTAIELGHPIAVLIHVEADNSTWNRISLHGLPHFWTGSAGARANRATPAGSGPGSFAGPANTPAAKSIDNA
jgi:hypothetical protein